MKFCPICGQQIQDAALRCRHCKNWLLPPNPGAVPHSAVFPYAPKTASGLAIASLVLGILWMYWVGSILALALGYLALREIRHDPQRINGKGMAKAGILLGWLGVATLFLAIIAGAYIWKNDQNHETHPPGASTSLAPST